MDAVQISVQVLALVTKVLWVSSSLKITALLKLPQCGCVRWKALLPRTVWLATRYRVNAAVLRMLMRVRDRSVRLVARADRTHMCRGEGGLKFCAVFNDILPFDVAV
jgi:hypothetical protein